MKKYFTGLLTGVLVMSLAISAVAISGRMTIEVDPVNIQVNGQTFAPTDVNGKEVPVFAYEGTTYAPLRALAEAYGLEVGYDATANMATVTDPDTPAVPTEDTKTTFHGDNEYDFDYSYEEFVGLWEGLDAGANYLFMARTDEATAWWNSAPQGLAEEYARKIASANPGLYYDFINKAGMVIFEVNP